MSKRTNEQTVLGESSQFLDTSPRGYLDDRPVDAPVQEVKPLTARQIKYQKYLARLKEQGLKRINRPRPDRVEFDNNDVVDNAPQALRLLTKFGGPTRLHRLARECGFSISYQTILGWKTGKTGGYIPHYAWPMILECARIDGLVLVSEDFDPRPFTLHKPKPLNRRIIGAHDVVPGTVGRKKGGKNGEPTEEGPL